MYSRTSCNLQPVPLAMAHSRVSSARRQPLARSTAHPMRPTFDSDTVGNVAGCALKGLALSMAILMAPVPASMPPAMAAQDAASCMKKCTKECNKIAPGSPDYCQETCADECTFMTTEGISAEEADGKAKVGNLGFLGGDFEGTKVDNALQQIFAGGKFGPSK